MNLSLNLSAKNMVAKAARVAVTRHVGNYVVAGIKSSVHDHGYDSYIVAAKKALVGFLIM